MSIGFARILNLHREVGNSGGLRVPQYQFTFNVGGNSYSKVVDEPHLVELLTQEIGLREDLVAEALKVVGKEGHATIPDVELSENDAAAMGLQEVGSDY